MLRAVPSKTGPSGYGATRRAPAQYRGTGGPGKLEITRLMAGRGGWVSPSREATLTAAAPPAGGRSSASSDRVVGSMRRSWALAWRVPSAMAARRSRGSSIVVARETSIADKRLAAPPPPSRVRVETGTAASSGRSTTSPRSARYARSAPAQVASTTSLTVAPMAPLTAVTSARSSWVNATRRRGPIVVLNGVGGPLNGGGGAAAPAVRLRRAIRRAAEATWLAATAALTG